ncbi:MAG: trehalose-phosphatase [Gammaproteobacteria bacterium]|nr:trehalose-phosphatase [Gammaproteobacteria bacterium]
MRSLPDELEFPELALFLDVDGTLLDIEQHPDYVRADGKLSALLARIAGGLGGALSLISGRSIADIDRIFAPAKFPAAGAHGAELRLRADDSVSASSSALPSPIVDQLQAFADTHSGLLLEKKPGGVSLHYRRASDLEQQCRELVNVVMAEIGQDFRLIAGKMVFELAPRAHDKGAAIRAMMRHEPFADRCPVFIGDDVTDEDGFHVVNAMKGMSVRVGDNTDSAARYVIQDVAAVRSWLESVAEQVAG